MGGHNHGRNHQMVIVYVALCLSHCNSNGSFWTSSHGTNEVFVGLIACQGTRVAKVKSLGTFHHRIRHQFRLAMFHLYVFSTATWEIKKTLAIASRRNPNVVLTLGTNSPEKMNSWRTSTNGKWMIYCYLCLKFPGSAPKIHNHMAWWAWNAGRWKTMPLFLGLNDEYS